MIIVDLHKRRTIESMVAAAAGLILAANPLCSHAFPGVAEDTAADDTFKPTPRTRQDGAGADTHAGAGPAGRAAHREVIGCAVYGGVEALGAALQGGGKMQISPTSGDATLDQLFAFEYPRLVGVMRVQPRFFFLNDSGNRNAYAMVGESPTDPGMVCYGIEMATSFIKGAATTSRHPGAPMLAVMAHEFGHITQFAVRRMLASRHQWKYPELHADYLAGWYSMIRWAADFNGSQQLIMGSIRNAALTQFDFGDSDFNSPNHHGTKQERLQAFMGGAQAALSGVADINQAFMTGKQFVGY